MENTTDSPPEYEPIKDFSNIKDADHLSVAQPTSWAVLYFHHLIYISETAGIIHFSPERKPVVMSKKLVVKLDDIRTLRRIGRIVRVKHKDCLPAKETVAKAYDMLNSKPEYNLFENNCEHLATECKTGKRRSFQIEKLKNIIETSQKRLMDLLHL